MFRYTLLFSIAILSLTACTKIAHVDGYVVDANTKEPIPGVVVTDPGQVRSSMQRTNYNGQFGIFRRKSGHIYVRFQKEGYQTQTVYFENSNNEACIYLKPE